MDGEFNPKNHIEKIGKGESAYDYLPVEYRVIWLRESAPDASIESEMTYFDGETVIFKATVRRPDIDAVSIAHAMKTRKGFDKNGKETVDKEWFQKAETKALGRALANFGFGTENADDGFDDEQEVPALSSAPAANNSNPVKAMTENQIEYIKNLKSEIGDQPVEDEIKRMSLDKRKMTEPQARELIKNLEKKFPAQK